MRKKVNSWEGLIVMSYVDLIEVPARENKENGRDEILEEVKAKTFPKLVDKTILQIQETPVREG